ncbi:hypothetical protein L195_g022389 [Trifolium pratense]|uniref:Chromo domain-containing protein n=1 Tax=Trifolium pratense TaxID=57577 RepID=A0A2K3N7X2_TRIPR|nr:hypothetical protein L195_g022389 [Trifolium pratense]
MAHSGIYPEKVMGSRNVRQGNNEVQQSLIKWKHKSMEDVTWEDNDFLRGQFPEFCLEDKAFAEEGGIDRNVNDIVGFDKWPKPRLWQVYTRKRTKEDKDVARKA